MFDTIKNIAAIILMVGCFIYILRRPGVSMMDNLLQHKKKKMEEQMKAQKEAEERDSADPKAPRDSSEN